MTNSNRRKYASIAVVSVIVVAIAAIAFYFYDQDQKSKALDEELANLANQTYVVEIGLAAKDLDLAKSTPVPMQIVGTDYAGNSVENTFLYKGTTNPPIDLKRGSYEVQIKSSPINQDGGIYTPTISSVSFVVVDEEAEKRFDEEKRDDLSFDVASDANLSAPSLEMEPIPELKVTKKMLREIKNSLVTSGYDPTDAEKFYNMARKARSKAIAAEKKRKAEAERKRQASRQFHTQDLSLTVPDSWGGTKWHYTPEYGDVSRAKAINPNARFVTYYFYPAGSSTPAFEAGYTNCSNPGEDEFVASARGGFLWFNNFTLPAGIASQVRASIR